MASNAQRNIASVLALCEGAALIVSDQYKDRVRNKTAMTVTRRVKAACREAGKLWLIEIDQKELGRIHQRLKAVEET